MVDRDAAGAHVAATEVQAHVKGHVGAQVAFGEFNKTVGQHLVGPGRQHNGHVAGGTELDLAVFAEGAQAGVATEHHAVVEPRLGHGGRAAAGATQHVDQFACHQPLAQVGLALGADHDFRIAVFVDRQAANERATAVAHVHDLATGHHLTKQVGVAQRVDDNAACFLSRAHAACARQFDTSAVGGHA